MENTFKKNCIETLTTRILKEEESARLYEAMSLWLNNAGFVGAAKALAKNAEDEWEHAQWAKDFILDMGTVPKLSALAEPPHDFGGLPDIIRQVFDHEVVVTQQCNDLANYAFVNGNHLLYQLAIKYMQEQQEELGKAQTWLDKLNTFGEDKVALKLLDNDMGS